MKAGETADEKLAEKFRTFFVVFGKIILGDTLEALEECVKPASVDLIMTSPPFGLVRKQEPLDKEQEV